MKITILGAGAWGASLGKVPVSTITGRPSKKFGARSICASRAASQFGSGGSGVRTSAMMERPRMRMKGRVSVIVTPNR